MTVLQGYEVFACYSAQTYNIGKTFKMDLALFTDLNLCCVPHALDLAQLVWLTHSNSLLQYLIPPTVTQAWSINGVSVES